MKRFLKILGGIVFSICLLLILTFAILSSNKVQNSLISKVTTILSESLETDISIQAFDFRPFNRLNIKEIYIEDQHGDTLVYIPEIKARFNLIKLVNNKLKISNAEIIEPRIYASTNQGVNNYDFLLDKFRSNKEKERKPFNLEIEIGRAMIDNGVLSYDNDTAKRIVNKFDINHFKFYDINFTAVINEFKRGSIDAGIEHFSFAEHSGFVLNDFQAHLISDTTMISMPTLRLELPNSLVDVSVLKAEFPEHAPGERPEIGKTSIDFILDKGTIVLGDLGAFVPAVRHMRKPIDVRAVASGQVDSLRLSDLNIFYNQYQLVDGNISVLGFPDINNSFIHANVNRIGINAAVLQDLLSDMKNRPVILPDMVTRLGEVLYRGKLRGRMDSLQLRGGFSSAVGSISTIGSLKRKIVNDSLLTSELIFTGGLETSNIELGYLLDNPDMGNVAFRLDANGRLDTLRRFSALLDGTVDNFDYKDYNYQGLQIKGDYSPNGFSGALNLHDDNLWFDFNGIADWHAQVPTFIFNLTIDSLHPGELNLAKEEYADTKLRLRSQINLRGNSLDNLCGTAELQDIYFYNDTSDILIPKITLSSQCDNNLSTPDSLQFTSGYLDFKFSGSYKYSTIPATFKKVFAQYLPHFFSDKQKKELQETKTNNNIRLNLYTHNLNELTEILALNIHIADDMTLKGMIDENRGLMDIGLVAPGIDFGRHSLRNIIVNLNNRENTIQLAAKLRKLANKAKKASVNMGDFDLMLRLDAARDSVWAYIHFANDSINQLSRGELKAVTTFSSDRGQQLVKVSFIPSEFTFMDIPWKIGESEMKYTAADTTLDIDHFQLASVDITKAPRHIYIHGRGSKQMNDSILVDLQNISLRGLVGLSGFYGLDFGGEVTGYASVHGLFKQIMLDADLDLQNFAMNDVPVGYARAQAEWVRDSTMLHYFGDVKSYEDGSHVAHLDGAWKAKRKSWNLGIDSKSVPIGFVNAWIGKIFGELNGGINGRVDINGDTTGVAITADALIENGSLSVDAIGTTYYFNDTVRLTKDSIILHNIEFHDFAGNPVDGNGYLTHDHFKRFAFNFDIISHDAQVMNLSNSHFNSFYGNVFANGKVKIYGNQRGTTIDVRAITRPNSTFGLSLNKTSTAVDNDYITFRQHNNEPAIQPKTMRRRSRTTLNLNIDVTPDALVALHLDKRTGDVIQARGEGNVIYNMQLPSGGSDIRGHLDITWGTVKYTISNIIHKEFKIESGSAIDFNGEPSATQLNVRASYSTSASLSDLMGAQFYQSGLSRSYVPVNAIIGINGRLNDPKISYDIQLPNSDETARQQVKSIINTEELKTKEILYLLAFNKFYTPDYLQTNQSVGTAESLSLLSSTVTGQLNNWLSKLTRDFQVGFNVHTSGNGYSMSQEYEGQFMYQLNNRLEINGNFGYRYNDISNRPFFGDLDIEYLLTESGKYRIKAYTHSVDKYSLKQASTIQGVGFVFKQSFDSYQDLFNIKPKKQSQQPTDSVPAIANDSMQAAPSDTLQTLPADTILNDSIKHNDTIKLNK